MEKKIGKIKNVRFGHCGYQECMIGLNITLGNSNWEVGDCTAYWDSEIIKWSKDCKWDEKDRDQNFAKLIRYVSKLLKEAKVNNVDELKGKPIEATFEGNILKEWRILTEAL